MRMTAVCTWTLRPPLAHTRLERPACNMQHSDYHHVATTHTRGGLWPRARRAHKVFDLGLRELALTDQAGARGDLVAEGLAHLPGSREGSHGGRMGVAWGVAWA
eukprot:1144112-Prymnesium_polylepis.1